MYNTHIFEGDEIMDIKEAKEYTDKKIKELRLIRRKDTLQVLKVPLIVTGTTIACAALSHLFECEEIKLITHISAIAATCLTGNSYIASFDEKLPINAEIKALKECRRNLNKNKNPYEKVLVYKRRTYRRV